tara:strand:- start:567 stop:716 length:150 start_codon:yes stop_codon:yes gene_type:complete
MKYEVGNTAWVRYWGNFERKGVIVKITSDDVKFYIDGIGIVNVKEEDIV